MVLTGELLCCFSHEEYALHKDHEECTKLQEKHEQRTIELSVLNEQLDGLCACSYEGCNGIVRDNSHNKVCGTCGRVQGESSTGVGLSYATIEQHTGRGLLLKEFQYPRYHSIKYYILYLILDVCEDDYKSLHYKPKHYYHLMIS